MSGGLSREDVRDEFRILFHDSISQECSALSRQVQAALTQEFWRVFEEFRKETWGESKLGEHRDGAVDLPPHNQVSTPPVGPAPLLHIQPLSGLSASGVPHAPSLTGGNYHHWDASCGTALPGSTAWPSLRSAALGVAELPAHPTEGVKKITLQSSGDPDHVFASNSNKPSLGNEDHTEQLAPWLEGITNEDHTKELESEPCSGTASMTSDYIKSSGFKSLRVGRRNSGRRIDSEKRKNIYDSEEPVGFGIKVHPAPDEEPLHGTEKAPRKNSAFATLRPSSAGSYASFCSQDTSRHSVRSNAYEPFATKLEVLPGDELSAPDEMYEAWLPEKLRVSKMRVSTTNSETSERWAPAECLVAHGRVRSIRFSGITKFSQWIAVILMIIRGRVSMFACLVGFMQSEYFDYIMGIVVLMNAILIGVQVDHMARHNGEEVPTSFRIIDGVFCVLFLVELLLRFSIHRVDYFTMTGWQWNIFDLVVVSFQVIDEIAKLFLTGTEVQETIDSLGVLRMLRLARILRLIRMVRLIPELRSMVYLLSASMWSFFWTAVLLLMLMFCVAVYFTEIATDLLRDGKVKDPEAVIRHYGSLGDSVRSLFQAITGGDDWIQFVEPFKGGSGYFFNTLIFSLYVAFTMLVMLNLVTGVFVDGAQKIVQQDKDSELVRHVKKLFQLTDQDESGEISWTEFEAQLETDKMVAYLDSVEIGKTEARALFKLLDTDRSGEVNVEEFVLASLKLRGPAKSMDLNALKYDFEEITAMWGMRFITIDLNLRKLLDAMERIASTVSQDNVSQLRALEETMEQDLV